MNPLLFVTIKGRKETRNAFIFKQRLLSLCSDCDMTRHILTVPIANVGIFICTNLRTHFKSDLFQIFNKIHDEKYCFHSI